MQLINICATQVNATDKAINLAQTIIKTYNKVSQIPTKSAIQLGSQRPPGASRLATRVVKPG